jgi:hypothetical protein
LMVSMKINLCCLRCHCALYQSAYHQTLVEIIHLESSINPIIDPLIRIISNYFIINRMCWDIQTRTIPEIKIVAPKALLRCPRYSGRIFLKKAPCYITAMWSFHLFNDGWSLALWQASNLSVYDSEAGGGIWSLSTAPNWPTASQSSKWM